MHDRLKKLFYNQYFWLIAGLFLVFLSLFLRSNETLTVNPDVDLGRFEATLHEKEAEVREEMDDMVERLGRVPPSQIFRESQNRLEGFLEKKGLSIFVYQKGSLAFWTDNIVPVDRELNPSSFHSRLTRFRNGWYSVQMIEEGEYTIVGLVLLRTDYPYQNNYLTNDYYPGFGLPQSVELVPKSRDLLTAYDANDEAFCSFRFPIEDQGSKRGRKIFIWLDLFGIALIILFFHKQIEVWRVPLGGNLAIVSYSILLITFRVLMLLYEFPQSFYDRPLFGPEYYASTDFFPSLGDFFVNILLLFYISYMVNSRLQFKAEKLQKFGRFPAIFLSAVMLLGLFLMTNWCDELIRGLIADSNISFDVNNFFSLDATSLAGFFIIGMLLFSFFLLADKVVELMQMFPFNRIVSAGIIVFSGAVYMFIYLEMIGPDSEYDFEPLIVLWPMIILLMLLFFKGQSTKRSSSFNYIIILNSIFALYAADALSDYVTLKEYGQRELLAVKLSDNEDPFTELSYRDMEKALLSDNTVLEGLSDLDQLDLEEFETYLEQQYFNGYLAKYQLEVYAFKADSTAVAEREADKRKGSLQYFDELIKLYGRETLAKNFYYIDNSKEKENYILKLSLSDPQTGAFKGVAFVALESKLIPERIGFPDLLLDKRTKFSKDLSAYSFAKYRYGELVYQFGNYPYSVGMAEFPKVDSSQFFHDEGYSHLIYPADETLTVVVSKDEEGFVAKATTFSYLFAFFSLMVLILILARSLSHGWLFTNLNFKSKIQVLMVAVILISMILFGLGTGYYINIQYAKKNYKTIGEKIQSVLIEVENKLGGEKELNQELKPYMFYILTKFSNVFFTDINLYDLNGGLLASSRPKLFKEGLVARTMHPSAFLNMAVKKKSEYIHEEKIGKLDYLSAYVPFKNKEGEILAYLNLPYFAKQSELENEISSFLVALINIYVFLFALSVVVALIISNFITEPLRLIQNMLSQVELGKTNDPIKYEGRDEIGTLVSVYNEKVAELERSAQLLARSERESAWREMAKQVAHEIKNPLTPMKLSVQHLQRSWKHGAEDWGEKLDRFTTTIIEQIDTLSTIASEFSNFAKMPRAQSEEVDLMAILKSVLELFREIPGASVAFESSEEEAIVYADRDHLVRVFNNLVKNARQAIPEGREGKVEVHLSRENNTFLVQVRDNGSGIAKEQQEKIFVPNFTTKTGGMGLGLAMVKNMVENANGQVWFETEEDKGTTFFVRLPVMRNV